MSIHSGEGGAGRSISTNKGLETGLVLENTCKAQLTRGAWLPMPVHPPRLAGKPVIEAIARSILRRYSDGDDNARLDEAMGMHCKHLKNSEVLWSS